MNDFIVTKIERNGRQFLAAAYFEENRLCELSVRPVREESRVGKIYVGSIDSTVKNIGGAFIRITKDFKCFLPNFSHIMPGNRKQTPGMSEDLLFADRIQNTQGHILVRITKDAAGVKEAVCSTVPEIAGKYCVISPGKTSLSVSKKIGDEEKALLKKWVNPHDYPGIHILLRTNAASAKKKDILSELSELSTVLTDIIRRAENAKPGTCLYSPEPFYLSMLRDLYTVPDRAFSDIPAIAGHLHKYMVRHEDTEHSAKKAGQEPEKQNAFEETADNSPENPCLIHPRTLSLAGLYNLEHEIDRLSQKIVWLKSGAYLVIERTEAFVIIDVNTGRCTKGRIPEETYRKINLEAAEEVLRQLRLRELSGMILIDFIKLENEDHRSELFHVIKKLARKEHRHTEVFDLTKLGILEMIREKKEKPLEEVLQ